MGALGLPDYQVDGYTQHAALGLVTCGGAFDERSRSYRENVIGYASLTASAPS